MPLVEPGSARKLVKAQPAIAENTKRLSVRRNENVV
jgi:hypothetical protein